MSTNNNNEIISSTKVWNVVNINTIAKPLGNDYYLSSSPFTSDAYPTISWEICIFLNGYQGGTYGSVNVELRQVGLKGNDCVKAQFYLYAIQNNGLQVDIGRSTQEFKYWTYSSRFNVLMQNLLQNDGSITVGCEVKFSLKDINLEYVKKDESAIYSKLLLQNLLKNNEFMDCVVQIGEEEINAHRSILAQNSVVFRRMFEQIGMVEAQNVRLTRKRSFKEINNKGIVRIDDCTAECFHALLEYCYTGIVSNDKLDILAEDLFAAAHKYEITPLKDKCEIYMASTIDFENFYHLCRIVQTYGSPILEDAISKFISANRTIFNSKEWKTLKVECVVLTQRLMESIICDS